MAFDKAFFYNKLFSLHGRSINALRIIRCTILSFCQLLTIHGTNEAINGTRQLYQCEDTNYSMGSATLPHRGTFARGFNDNLMRTCQTSSNPSLVAAPNERNESWVDFNDIEYSSISDIGKQATSEYSSVPPPVPVRKDLQVPTQSKDLEITSNIDTDRDDYLQSGIYYRQVSNPDDSPNEYSKNSLKYLPNWDLNTGFPSEPGNLDIGSYTNAPTNLELNTPRQTFDFESSRNGNTLSKSHYTSTNSPNRGNSGSFQNNREFSSTNQYPQTATSKEIISPKQCELKENPGPEQPKNHLLAVKQCSDLTLFNDNFHEINYHLLDANEEKIYKNFVEFISKHLFSHSFDFLFKFNRYFEKKRIILLIDNSYSTRNNLAPLSEKTSIFNMNCNGKVTRQELIVFCAVGIIQLVANCVESVTLDIVFVIPPDPATSMETYFADVISSSTILKTVLKGLVAEPKGPKQLVTSFETLFERLKASSGKQSYIISLIDTSEINGGRFESSSTKYKNNGASFVNFIKKNYRQPSELRKSTPLVIHAFGYLDHNSYLHLVNKLFREKKPVTNRLCENYKEMLDLFTQSMYKFQSEDLLKNCLPTFFSKVIFGILFENHQRSKMSGLRNAIKRVQSIFDDDDD